MSIHKSDRTLSRKQYEDSFKPLYDAVRQKMMRVPKRRQRFVAKPVLEMMNHAYDAILRIEEDPVPGDKDSAQIRYDCIVNAQLWLKAVEKPLYTYWNICADSAERDMAYQNLKKRANLCDMFNSILVILHDMQKASSKYSSDADTEGDIKLMYYTDQEIANAEFLCKLRDLHRMTHTKIVRLNAIFKDAEAELIRELIDDAWYCAVHGNQMRLDVPKEYEQRKKLFSQAIGDLGKIQRPIFSLFSIGNYSNREMSEWMNLLNESLRLLKAIQASDKERTK